MNIVEYIRMEGKKESQITVVKNMIAKGFLDETIASLIGVSLDFAKEVHQGKKK